MVCLCDAFFCFVAAVKIEESIRENGNNVVDHILLNMVNLGRCINTHRHILMLAVTDTFSPNVILLFDLTFVPFVFA